MQVDQVDMAIDDSEVGHDAEVGDDGGGRACVCKVCSKAREEIEAKEVVLREMQEKLAEKKNLVSAHT